MVNKNNAFLIGHYFFYGPGIFNYSSAEIEKNMADSTIFFGTLYLYKNKGKVIKDFNETYITKKKSITCN